MADVEALDKPSDVRVTAGHKDAGLLQLTATSEGTWVLRIWGTDYRLGWAVRRGERRGDEVTPARRTIARAANVALEIGPENPPDSWVFIGDEQLTVADWMGRNA